MKEMSNQEFENVVDLFKENMDVFEDLEFDLSYEGMIKTIELEFEEYKGLQGVGTGKKRWTEDDYLDLSMVVDNFFMDDFVEIIKKKDYEVGFRASKYLYEKLLPIGSNKSIAMYTMGMFDQFNQIWSKCYKMGSPELKEEIKNWAKNPPVKSGKNNYIAEWQGVFAELNRL